jgi:tetratricopeptide (TPR) repeat protein
VAPAYREALAAVLLAFDRAPTQSRLLLDSRYDFRLPDGKGGDLANGLVRVPLKPMAARERNKQWRAAGRFAGRAAAELDEAGNALLERALDAAAGNPGLQAVLTKPILAGEFAAGAEALRQIDVYRETGAPPAEIEALIKAGTAKDSDNALTAFFAHISFKTYSDALTADQRRQLGAATLFSPEVPIPIPALAAVGAANGVDAPDKAISRLLGLGLFDDWGAIGGFPHAAANPLAGPLAPKLDEDDRPRLARAAMPELAKAWRNADGAFPFDPRGLEAAELAIRAVAEPAILEDAALSGAAWLGRVGGQTRDARELIATAFAAFPAGHAFGPNFLRLGCEWADRLGDMKLREALLAAPLRQIEPDDTAALTERAYFNITKSEYRRASGAPEAAEELIREALHVFSAAFDDRGVAFASGHIADILQARGELDQALKIRREEQLPVYERLGEARERAVANGRIADILQARGQLDDALKIRQEDQLPVFDRLGEVRERAVAMGKIADILQARGDLDQALKIRREDQLPVYERLGDVRSRAATLSKIAGVLLEADGIQRGCIQEIADALGESFRIFVELGAPDGIGAVGALLAQVLAMGGLRDEALRVLDQSEAAYRMLSQTGGVDHVRELRELIEKS